MPGYCNFAIIRLVTVTILLVCINSQITETKVWFLYTNFNLNRLAGRCWLLENELISLFCPANWLKKMIPASAGKWQE
jgi:hypothetical protein